MVRCQLVIERLRLILMQMQMQMDVTMAMTHWKLTYLVAIHLNAKWGTQQHELFINRDLNIFVYISNNICKGDSGGFASLTSGAADGVVTNADNLRMLREDELLPKRTANLLLSMLRCRCAATR